MSAESGGSQERAQRQPQAEEVSAAAAALPLRNALLSARAETSQGLQGKTGEKVERSPWNCQETATSSSHSLTENVKGCEVSGENAERVASFLLVCRYLRVAGLGARTLD